MSDPLSPDPLDAGTSGWVKRLSQISVVSALIIFFGGLLWAYRQDMNQIITWYREDVKAIVQTHKDTSDQMWKSLNTTNHAVAGMVNGMEQLLAQIRSLQDDVKALNKVAGRLPPDGEPAKAAAVERP